MLVVVLGGAGGLALLTRPAGMERSRNAAHDSGQGARLPPLATAEPHQQATSSRRIVLSSALARAVAAVGQVDDGRRTDLSGLDEEALVLLDQARFLLGTVRRRQGAGLPMRFANGSVMRAAPDRGAGAIRDTSDLPPLGPPPQVVDGALVARTLDARGRLPTPTRGDRVKELLVADAWIAIPYDPRLVSGEPLVITNHSDGRYGLSIEAGDAGTVRLNGGLIVPGRYYLLDGTIRVEAAVPVGVHIRPLDALPGYYEHPLVPPSANG